jgi:hypothetical protein
MQEINSSVTLEVRNATPPGAPGHGQLVPSQIQLQQGQKTVSCTYTFVEPIIIIARDNAGNAPATSNAIVITPGLPDSIRLSSSPQWVGGDKHATLTAFLMDEFENAVPGAPMTFTLLQGSGSLSGLDSVTTADGVARADYHSASFPEPGRIRAQSGGVIAEIPLETAFVDPNAKGGFISNYPNPFHPPNEPTTLAYKLDGDAEVRLRIFTLAGNLVLDRTYSRGGPGGLQGLNEVTWDGKNGENRVVASGGYLVLIEAQGTGETLHVIRRKIAVVR